MSASQGTRVNAYPTWNEDTFNYRVTYVATAIKPHTLTIRTPTNFNIQNRCVGSPLDQFSA